LGLISDTIETLNNNGVFAFVENDGKYA